MYIYIRIRRYMYRSMFDVDIYEADMWTEAPKNNWVSTQPSICLHPTCPKPCCPKGSNTT